MENANKKTTTRGRKPSIKKEVTEEAVVNTTIAKASEKIKYEASAGIACKSCCPGKLIMKGLKTGETYIWADIDDITEVEYQDLYAAKVSKSAFLYKPLIIVQEEDLVSQWKEVSEVYENMYSVGDLASVLNMPNSRMIKIISEMPEGGKTALKQTIMQKFNEGSFDSVAKIKIVDEILGTDLMSLL